MVDTLMILGANTLQIPLIEKANDMGYQTLVLSPNKSEPGHNISTFSEFIDIRDEEKVLEIAKKYNLCGVITDQTDLPVRTMAYVSERLNLPGNKYETACLFTNKYLMREKCKELGIKTLRYRLCSTLDEAIIFFKQINDSLIIKPIDNQGSKGVYKVSNIEELKNKFEESIEYSIQKKVLIEEYVTGREFVVEGICFDYEFKNLMCGDTHYFNIPDVFSATIREFPSQANVGVVNRVLDINEKIIKGFQLKQGITHSEFIMNGEDIILIETAARGGGVFISSDLIYLQTGLETEEFLINIATGKINKMPNFNNLRRNSCYISMFLPVGEVVAMDGIEEVINLDYVYHNNLENIYVGMKTKPFTDKTARYFMIVDAPDHNTLLNRISLIKNMIKISIHTKDGNMEGPIWK